MALPNTYKQVAYIESSNTQYIETGLSSNGSYFKVDYKFQLTSTSSNYSESTPFLWGPVQGGQLYQTINYPAKTNFQFGAGNDDIELQSIAINTDYTVKAEWNNGTLSTDINGTTATNSYSGGLSTHTIPIFCRWRNSSQGYDVFSSIKLYYFKMYTASNTLARDFVPCYRKSDNKPGLYDLVNDVFYTNQGIGEFAFPSEPIRYTSKLILNGEEYQFAAPEQGWQPGANTLLYMPLNGDVLDYSGNQNNGTWIGTTDYRNIGTGSKKYAYINTDSAIALTSFPVGTGDPNDLTFACWTKTNQTTGYSIPFYMGTDARGNRFNLILNYKYSASSYVHLIDLYGYDEDIVFMSSPSNVGGWICVVYTYNKSLHEHTIYINNTQAGSSSNYSLNIGNNFKYIGRSLPDSQYTNYGLSEIVFESGIWTSEQRSDYFNQTKSLYGIS